MSINKYRIYCITESTWIESYSTSPPINCLNDTNHTVNIDSIHILQTIEPNTVFVETERINTGGHYRAQGFMKEIPSGVTGAIYTFDESYPHPINLTLVTLTSDNNASGDFIYTDVAPNTIIGINTTEVLGTTSIISVNNTVIQNLKIGYEVDVFTGTTSYPCGRCILIDTNNSTITTELSVSETVSMGNYIRMSIRNIEYFLSNNMTKTFGTGKIGSSYIPANTTLRITYQNNNGQAKRFWIDNEFTY